MITIEIDYDQADKVVIENLKEAYRCAEEVDPENSFELVDALATVLEHYLNTSDYKEWAESVGLDA